ncbi:hypothetical protein [Lysobacter sp. ESA13C]|uniref:hypothetical protein n=1 Tax=Lysobacter sp. ESA13C TaxID=2862676 RepID=UPI001CBD1621|nr:hypothetical protein [Lysobacter sp. ESA13C]
MKTRHTTDRREPAKGRRFAWSRLPDPDRGRTHWRLFRRSETTRRIIPAIVEAKHTDSRSQIAEGLRRARWELRNDVDAIDLLNLGVTP